jgi:hypothetical protein
MGLIDTCQRCIHWTKPDPANQEAVRRNHGRCRLDARPAHAGYRCGRYLATDDALQQLGVTDAEVDRIRSQSANVAVVAMLVLCRAILVAPNDGGLRGLFDAELSRWRDESTSARV